MLREISTYGALLLTALVVYRASSLDTETIKTEQLYQREADQQFSTTNILLRSQIGAELKSYSESKLLANVSCAKKKMNESISTTVANNAERNASELSNITIADEITFRGHLEVEEDLSLSLDRESTINRSLSIHAPRQRIQPKPSLD